MVKSLLSPLSALPLAVGALFLMGAGYGYDASMGSSGQMSQAQFDDWMRMNERVHTCQEHLARANTVTPSSSVSRSERRTLRLKFQLCVRGASNWDLANRSRTNPFPPPASTVTRPTPPPAFGGSRQQWPDSSMHGMTNVTPSGRITVRGPLVNPPMEIYMKDFVYHRSTLDIKAGTTVKWTNHNGVSHAIASDTFAGLNSGHIQDQGTFSFTFNTPGMYEYYDPLYPSMTGTIWVSANE